MKCAATADFNNVLDFSEHYIIKIIILNNSRVNRVPFSLPET